MAEGEFETGFVEHAYIEPEAGFAAPGRRSRSRSRPARRRPIWTATTSRAILRPCAAKRCASCRPRSAAASAPSSISRCSPSSALAAWKLDRPVRMVYTRPESMMSTTKRHPAQIRATIGATPRTAHRRGLHGDFNTGAYASWGPTVANRVPVHALRPLCHAELPRDDPRHPHASRPAGAFRGFGVPQARSCRSALSTSSPSKLGIDPLEFRLRNALDAPASRR